YNLSCVNITGVTFNTTVWDDAIGTGYAYPSPGIVSLTYSTLGNDHPPGDYPIANLTIECTGGAGTCCISDLIFIESYITNTTLGPWYGDHDVPGENGTVVCGEPSITVDKKVWDGSAWVDEIPDADIGDEYRFRINVTATCCNFTNLWVNDTFDAGLTYNDSANPAPAVAPPIGQKGGEIKWFFPTLNKSETKTMYFNVTVNNYDRNCNVANATAWCPEPGFKGRYSGKDEACIVSAPSWVKEIYFVPQNSSAPYCNTTEVEIWVNGTGMFQSGQINLTYDPACADVVDWVRNTDVFPHGDWDSSKPGEEWITFARNDEIDGRYKVGTLTIHCNNTCYCSTPLDMVDVYEVGDDVRHSELFDHDMKPIKTAWRDGNFTCTNPDLIVTDIALTPDAPSLGDRAAGPVNITGAKTQCNNITATIKNIGNGDVGPFHVCFNITNTTSGAKVASCKEEVESLGAGASTTVWCNCSWYPYAYENYTITVTADYQNEVTECNESNNTMSRYVVPIVNGLKGNGWQDGRSIDTVYNTTQGHFNLRYSTGDSYRLSGYSNKNWTTYKANWTADNLSIPNAANVMMARLYVYYGTDKTPNHNITDTSDGYYVNLTFNSVDKRQGKNYQDRPLLFSNYWKNAWGMVVYDVTNEFDAIGSNRAVLDYTWPANSYRDLSITGMLLVVVYEHENEPERIIYINDGFDLLYAKDVYGVSSEEATAYATFNVTEDISKFARAKLITVAPHANEGDDHNRLYFNDKLWKGVWSGYHKTTQLGIDERDVQPYLKQGENTVKFQSHINRAAGETKGDNMEASNAFLVLEKGKRKIVMIDPAEKIVQPQNQFDLDVVVDPYNGTVNGQMVDVYAVQYTLKYDPSVLRAESQVEGDFLKQDGNDTI
ncbi:MAG: hypothetical protein DRN92_08520, partial [Thermoproteota archaeon]